MKNMSKEHELPSDSDDDDEDYIPGGADSEVGSEAESEGEIESGPENGESNENVKDSRTPKGKRGKKRGKNSSGSRKKSRKTNDERCEEEDDDERCGEEAEERKKLSEEEEKKRADSLWADFMKDAPIVSKAKPKSETINGSQSTFAPPLKVAEECKAGKSREVEKVKITKLFEFAGEEVRVEKEVPADSAEARLSLPSSDPKSDSVPSNCGARGRGVGIRRGGLGGISSVLGQLGKKAKISVLEKSKLDWDSYKKEEKIEEEISTHNKGKGGYLEKQDFLQRADLRQFEIEKQLRSNRRSTR